MLWVGYMYFLVIGDVYCCDVIDVMYYFVFYQMEGFCVFIFEEWEVVGSLDGIVYVVQDLKKMFEGLVCCFFGEVEMCWVDCYFLFIEFLYELEIFFQGKWLEVLGCGVIE